MSRSKTLPSGEPRPRYDAERLLDVAARVFTERGYDGTSMEDLSRASGLSKSSLYHHVASKEQLLRRALERAVDPLFAIVDEPGASDGRAVDRLEYVIDRAVHVLAERLPYVTLLLHVHGNTETERWALDRRRAFDKLIARLVREAVDDGDLRADVDPATTARLLLGMVNSLVEWYRPSARTHGAADRIAHHITTLAFEGLRT
ncbi:MAG TPA: TetR/AcrR family transcriptional regulator [Nocardioidaceae bacterium]|nr:TetR/AcrR family transcriptional regulator [Nocardioidaceae bacterium]